MSAWFISNLEQGKGVLTVEEILKLTVIFGKPVAELFRLLSERVCDELGQRLGPMSGTLSGTQQPSLRTDTLNGLMTRLSAHNQDAYGEYKHGNDGLLQSYAEVLGCKPKVETIRYRLRLFSKAWPKGHWVIPPKISGVQK